MSQRLPVRRRTLPGLALAATAGLGLLLAGPNAARADVYRWVDAQGRVQYSDVPVDGAVLIKTTVPRAAEGAAPGKAAASSVAPSETGRSTEGNGTSARLADEAARRQIAQEVASKRSEQCKKATERYDQSIAARRIFKDGPKGERIYLSETELAEQRLQAKRERDEACASAPAR
ncbi:MAG: DUF4124 domain-containing protein [Steroidobacteraceae bacterium]